MKNIFFLFFLLVSINIFGQEIPKKANKIIVSNEKSAADNFIFVKQLLADKGVEIANQDKEINQVKSGVIAITKYGANCYFIFNCKDKSIVITGMFKTGYEVSIGGVKDTDDYEKIEYRGMSGSLFKTSFEKMNDFAKILGDTLRYEVVN